MGVWEWGYMGVGGAPGMGWGLSMEVTVDSVVGVEVVVLNAACR